MFITLVVIVIVSFIGFKSYWLYMTVSELTLNI